MNAADLTKFFARTWKERYGAAYSIAYGKDGSIFKSLLNDFTAIEIQDMIRFYLFELQSRFAIEGGHTTGIFKYCVPEIIAEMQRYRKIEEANEKADKTDFQRLEEARKKL